jgi:hypothetical protein
VKSSGRPRKHDLFYLIGLGLLIAAGVIAVGIQHSGWVVHRNLHGGPIRVNDWVYITGDNLDPALNRFSGRPGQLDSQDEDGGITIRYQLQRSPAKAELRKIPRGTAVYHCPSQQEGVDGQFMGTIRIWNGGEDKPLQEQTIHDAELGDTVTVEIKDLDRWLFEQFDFGRLKNELEDIPSGVKDIVLDAVAERRVAILLAAINRVNYALRVPLRDEHLPEQSRVEAWQDLLKSINSDSALKRIKDKMPEPLEGEPPILSLENIAKVGRQFLPIKVWSHRVADRNFKKLTLTLNGIALSGITPLNAYNQAEQIHQVRPSFQEDMYEWARFYLGRRQVDPAASDGINDQAKANQNAWFRLIGRPAFRLPCNVTLKLVDQELELPTKISTQARDEECRFYLIGIEPWKFVAAVILFLGIILFLVWLAKTTNILRDSSGRVRADGLEPVSLAKTQMAFWFIVIACAFAFLWVTSGEYNTFNSTCLVLLGIGSVTALGAALIENPVPVFLVKSSLGEPRRRIGTEVATAIIARLTRISELLDDPLSQQHLLNLLAKLLKGRDEDDRHSYPPAQRDQIALLKEQLETKWKMKGEFLPSIVTEDDDEAIIAFAKTLMPIVQVSGQQAKQPLSDLQRVAAELDRLALQEREFRTMPSTAWKRLFADWLAEGFNDKYNFHRFQMLAWTLLLGFVFIAKVLGDRAMPEFNALTLGLLGISAGTYLGFKAKEQEAPHKT